MGKQPWRSLSTTSLGSATFCSLSLIQNHLPWALVPRASGSGAESGARLPQGAGDKCTIPYQTCAGLSAGQVTPMGSLGCQVTLPRASGPGELGLRGSSWVLGS